jgi:hypothetical protein
MSFFCKFEMSINFQSRSECLNAGKEKEKKFQRIFMDLQTGLVFLLEKGFR